MTDLTPIEQKEVDFHGRTVTAILVQDSDGRENIYVPLRPLVEGMGLDWSAQYRRVKKTTALNESCMSVAVTTTDIEQESTRPQTSYYLAIPITHLNGFLFGVSEHRVKSKLKPLIIAYQRECYQVLFEAFNGIESMIRFYRAIGHDGGWIKRRIDKHRTSTDLHDVWLLRGVPIEQHERLRDVLNAGTFGLTEAEHKKLKQLPDTAPLYDNMTRMELLISAIADESAIVMSDEHNPQAYDDNEQIAQAAARVGKYAAEGFKRETGLDVLSPKNHLDKKRPLLGNDNK